MESLVTNGLSGRSFMLAGSIVKPRLNMIQRGSVCVQVERQVMLVLLFLVEHINEVVTREEILSALWSDSFSNDEALTQAVSKLRRSLGDNAQTSQSIQTIRKVGYRLVGPVSARELTAVSAAVSTDEPLEKPHFFKKRSWSWVAIALIGAVTSLNAVALLARNSVPEQRMMRVRTIIPGVDTSDVDLASLVDLADLTDLASLADLADLKLGGAKALRVVDKTGSEIDASEIERILEIIRQSE